MRSAHAGLAATLLLLGTIPAMADEQQVNVYNWSDLIGANMLFNGGEAPSPVLAGLQWVLLIAGVIGLVGSLLQLNKK